MASKMQILSIYKALIRESSKFANYNFRTYALRRTRDAFKKNKSITDQTQIKQQYKFATDNLNIMKRQVAIGDMYGTDKLVIENVR